MLKHKETAVLPALFAFETRQGFLGHLIELALDVEPPDRRV
jgi:hypothetical protein